MSCIVAVTVSLKTCEQQLTGNEAHHATSQKAPRRWIAYKHTAHTVLRAASQLLLAGVVAST